MPLRKPEYHKDKINILVNHGHSHDNFNAKSNAKENHSNINCIVPFNTINISYNGDIYICSCEVFLPTPVGNILDIIRTENKDLDLNEIYKWETTKEILKTITQKTYEYCNTVLCGATSKINLNIPVTWDIRPRVLLKLPNMKLIEIGIENTCNLQCSSCRLNIINNNNLKLTNTKEHVKQLNLHNHMAALINNYDHEALIAFGGDGEPFFSKYALTIIEQLSYNPKHKYKFRSNGLSIKAVLPKLKIFPSVISIDISVDGATKYTHEKLRKGSNWNKVINNIKWLVNHPDRKFDITTVFVIQNENYKEISKFCDLMLKEIGVDYVSFLRYDYRSHLKDSFKENAICHNTHPNHLDYLDQLKLIGRYPDETHTGFSVRFKNDNYIIEY